MVGVGSVEVLQIVVVVGSANRREGRVIGGAQSRWKQVDAARRSSIRTH
jgi:hypothetical protein